jgi:hypothetical protein
MDNNVGRSDATFRSFLALLAVGAAIVFSANVVASLTFAVVAVLMIGTAMTRKCPAYTLLGFTTTEKAGPRVVK